MMMPILPCLMLILPGVVFDLYLLDIHIFVFVSFLYRETTLCNSHVKRDRESRP